MSSLQETDLRACLLLGRRANRQPRSKPVLWLTIVTLICQSGLGVCVLVTKDSTEAVLGSVPNDVAGSLSAPSEDRVSLSGVVGCSILGLAVLQAARLLLLSHGHGFSSTTEVRVMSLVARHCQRGLLRVPWLLVCRSGVAR